jgi:cell shape-determining protein MreD
MIGIGFILASFIALIQSALFPHIALSAYAPFIALVSLECSLPCALYAATLAGLCSDFLSSGPFGIHAITATLSCAALYHFRLTFLSTLPLRLCAYTALISAIQTPFMLIVLFLFDQHLPIAGKSLLPDCIVMPFADAAYAFFWFVGPLLIYEQIQKKWKLWVRNLRSL